MRGDADSIGFNETFTLRIQARLRKKPKNFSSSQPESKLSRRELETMYARHCSMHTNIRAGQSLTEEQVKMLRQAKKDGRMAGALLDIRTKSKSDKYG
jgi:protein FRG1